jgi:hypothetical protein
VNLKYILQGAAKFSTESTESPIVHMFETDYFNSALIEETGHI